MLELAGWPGYLLNWLGWVRRPWYGLLLDLGLLRDSRARQKHGPGADSSLHRLHQLAATVSSALMLSRGSSSAHAGEYRDHQEVRKRPRPNGDRSRERSRDGGGGDDDDEDDDDGSGGDDDDDDDAFVQATTRREERLDKMRDYFGEKIALYFAFLEGLIHSLLPLALVGTPVALLGQAYYGTADNLGATVYSICVLIWITTLCHVWQRQEARLRHRWSTDGYEDHERIRSHRRQFDGEDAPGARGEPHVCA